MITESQAHKIAQEYLATPHEMDEHTMDRYAPTFKDSWEIRVEHKPDWIGAEEIVFVSKIDGKVLFHGMVGE